MTKSAIPEVTTRGALYRKTVRFLVNELGAERAFILVGKRMVAYFGFDSIEIWKSADLPLELLEDVLSRGKPKHVLDAQQDRRLNETTLTLRSLLCVPLLDPEREIVGLIYADHSQPAALDHGARKRLDQWASEFGSRHSILEPSADEWVSEEPAEPPPPPRPPFPWGKLLKGALGSTHALR